MHALEAAPVNAAILRRVVQQSELAGLVTVHATGASDSVDAPLYARSDTRPGYEGGAVSLASRGSRIATTTADLLFEAERIPHAHMVTVDTEGWDGCVLAGMRAALAAERHAAAARTRPAHGPALPAGHPPADAWRLLRRRRASRRARLLSRVPGWTYSSSSTRCTGGDTGGASRSRPRSLGCCAPGTAASGRVELQRPARARASGNCWQEGFAAFHPSSWGNLICSHREDVLAVLQRRSLGPERGHLGEREPFKRIHVMCCCWVSCMQGVFRAVALCLPPCVGYSVLLAIVLLGFSQNDTQTRDFRAPGLTTYLPRSHTCD